jgi:hypothetical protein
MQFAASLKYLSSTLGAAALLCSGAAFAQTSGAPADPASQSAGMSAQPSGQSWQLVGVTARLDHALDSASAQQGQKVDAKLDGTVKTAQGVKLEKGTVLMGTVTGVQVSANGGPSSLTLAFTTAVTKDGKQIPVKATMLSAYPSSSNDLATYGIDDMGSAPRHIDPNENIDQESGLLNHISLHARVQAQDSGTFMKQDGNLKLAVGTYLQLGIAPVNGNMAANGE